MWEIVTGLLNKVFGIIDKAVPDRAAADKMKAELQAQMMTGDFNEVAKLIEARAQVLVAEAKSDSWLTKNWRPITMMVFVFIIFNNYVLFPYVDLFGYRAVMIETPPDLWAILKIGIGGYVFGRSIEKTVPSMIEAIKK